jgi:hypothetical protein
MTEAKVKCRMSITSKREEEMKRVFLHYMSFQVIVLKLPWSFPFKFIPWEAKQQIAEQR